MSYRQYRPTSFNFLPVGVKNLLIINGLFFLATLVFESSFQIQLASILGLQYWTSPGFKIYQLATHMFMHADFYHLFSNMFALWMFGVALENVWGTKRFIFFYLITALGAALMHQTVLGFEYMQIHNAIETFTNQPTVTHLLDAMKQIGLTAKTTYTDYLASTYKDGVIGTEDAGLLLNQLTDLVKNKLSTPTVGASGAVFGILMAFAMYYPNTQLYIYFAIPIKAKYFVAIYAAIELYLGIANNPNDNIAHFAHLGGALVGFILVKYWNKTNRKSFY